MRRRFYLDRLPVRAVDSVHRATTAGLRSPSRGYLDYPMPRPVFLLTTAMAVAVGMASPVAARDRLDSVVTKPTLSRQDSAVIKTEVADRVRKLVSAASDADARQKAVDTLVATVRLPQVSKPGLDVYTQACADALSPLMVDDELVVALSAVLALVALENVNTTDALSLALRSKHDAVRFKAARGLRTLHKDLAERQLACRTTLRALGRAGASEKVEVVLREIYGAIHFSADVPNFPYADECAAALSTVYAGRLDLLNGGSRDEWKEAPSFALAADCYAKAAPAQQTKLVQQLFGFLAIYVDRYCDDSTAKEYYPTIAGLIDDVEKVFRRMLQSSNVTLPSGRLSALAKPSKPDAGTRQQLRAALAALKEVLAKPPWNLS